MHHAEDLAGREPGGHLLDDRRAAARATVSHGGPTA